MPFIDNQNFNIPIEERMVVQPYKIRKSSDRGFFDHGWLKTYHTFSFAGYQDDKFMGFRDLRVINQDLVQAGKGFDTHPHRNMEIITVILEGELAHKDSMGSEEVIKKNDVQAMSAGTGIMHSEYNPSSKNPVHLLQIWILPDKLNVEPEYRQTKLTDEKNQWQLLASKSGENGSMKIHQDTNLYYIALDGGVEKKLPTNRYGWLQMMEGKLIFNGEVLQQGDGVAIEPAGEIRLKSEEASRLLFFDLK